jgi:hypothetical protein
LQKINGERAEGKAGQIVQYKLYESLISFYHSLSVRAELEVCLWSQKLMNISHLSRQGKG